MFLRHFRTGPDQVLFILHAHLDGAFNFLPQNGNFEIQGQRCHVRTVAVVKCCTNYVTSCDPHHDIYTFCYWQIFWHSIWHIFWHSIWHSIWHIFWHSIWHIFWHIIYSNLLAFYLANILALYLAYLLAFYLTFYLAFYLAYLLAFYLAYLLTFYLAYLLAYHLANLMAFYLAYLLAIYLTFYLAYLLAFYLAFEVQRCALNSEGPRLRLALRTELGRSQVEVQRCALSWEGPRLRSSSAHWAPKLAKSLAKSWQGNSGHGCGGRGGRRGGGRGGGEGGEGGGRRRRKRRRTTLIKSNSPGRWGKKSNANDSRFAFHFKSVRISSFEYQPTQILFDCFSTSVVVFSHRLMNCSCQDVAPSEAGARKWHAGLLNTNMNIYACTLAYQKKHHSLSKPEFWYPKAIDKWSPDFQASCSHCGTFNLLPFFSSHKRLNLAFKLFFVLVSWVVVCRLLLIEGYRFQKLKVVNLKTNKGIMYTVTVGTWFMY